ncbi:hypothetical protein RKD55_003158 [Rossellomorea marisflavi]
MVQVKWDGSWKTRLKWGFSALGIVSILLYLSIVIFGYKGSADLQGFPVPVAAHVMNETKSIKNYRWEPAAREGDLPLSYKVRLLSAGWRQRDKAGHTFTYGKGAHKVEMVTGEEYLFLEQVK